MALIKKKENYETVVLIPNYNGAYLLGECLPSLKKQTYKNFKIVVIDNASTDDTEELIDEKFSEVEILLRNKNDGFSVSMNEGMKYVMEKYNPKYMAPLNNDTVVDKDWLKNLVKSIESEKNIAAVASNMLFYGNRNLINSHGCTLDYYCHGVDINIFQKVRKVTRFQRYVLGVSWGAALIKTNTLKEVGFLDEKYHAYFEDLDWGWRANLMGYKCIFEKKAIVYHKYSSSWKNNNYQKVYLCKRNAVRTIIKNYELKNLFKKLPIIFVENLSFSFKSLYAKNSNLKSPKKITKNVGNHYNLKYALIPFKSLLWNTYYLPETLKLRKEIQLKRKNRDKEIPDLIKLNKNKLIFSKDLIFNFVRIFIYQSGCNLFDLTIGKLIGDENTFKLRRKINSFYNLILPSRKKVALVNKSNFGVNLLGYFDTESGIGEAARSLARAIESVKIPFVINNYSHNQSRKNNKEFKDYFYWDNPYPINIITIMGDTLEASKQYFGDKYFADKYNILHWFWELDKFPEDWIKLLNNSNVKEVWVSSKFIQNSLSQSSKVKSFVVNLDLKFNGDDINKYNREYFKISNERFVFLFMFDFYSIFERKNPLGVIKAFKKAFGESNKVLLLIKCINSHFDKKLFYNMRKYTKTCNNIGLMDYYLSADEVRGLINSCDCYVSLHRSEGFGLTMAEAMAFGKPVIASRYSGNLDFMNDSNSFLVNCRLKKLTKDYGPYKRGNVWAEPNLRQAAFFMRQVYYNQTLAKELGTKAQKYIAKKLNPPAIGRLIEKRLMEIKEQLKNAGKN